MELQPKWCSRKKKYSQVDRQESEGGWDTLRKLGINGFYSVLVVLAWWGQALALEKGSDT